MILEPQSKLRWRAEKISAADAGERPGKALIEQFKTAPAGTTGRAFLRQLEARPFNLQKRRRRP